jgi:hypothetical protein
MGSESVITEHQGVRSESKYRAMTMRPLPRCLAAGLLVATLHTGCTGPQDLASQDLVAPQNLTATSPWFISAGNRTVGTGPRDVVTGDWNGDGKLDLVVANGGIQSVPSSTVSLLLGAGNGTFQPAVHFTVGSGPYALAARDFNGDGKLDLAVALYYELNVSILLGQGDGTFQSPVAYATGSGPSSIATGDWNGDGQIDLALTNSNTTTISRLLGNGNGTFQTATTAGIGANPGAVVSGDWNSDGHADLAVALTSNANRVTLLFGNGTGAFPSAASYTAGPSPTWLATGDWNGDGKTDLVTANFAGNIYSGNSISILTNNGNGTFLVAAHYASGQVVRSVTAGDWDRDGALDLAVVNSSDHNVSVFPGAGDGSFQLQSPKYGVGTRPHGIATGDFNGDGKLDLAVPNRDTNNVTILLNQTP